MKFLGLDWRVTLYKRYWFYMRTCRNSASIIQYERKGKVFPSIKIRNGSDLYFPNIGEAHGFFREIWLEQIYTRFYQPEKHPRVVVDIGANIGTFTLFSQYLWPESVTYAYEPSPVTYPYLEKNTRTKTPVNIHLFNLAVSSKEEVETFFVKEHSGANSFFQGISNHQVKDAMAIQVNTVTLKNVLETAGGHVDFLKIDCEGAEWAILPGQEQALRQVDYVAMEYHIPPDKQLSDLVGIFERAGFDVNVQPPFPWGGWMLGFLYAKNLSYS